MNLRGRTAALLCALLSSSLLSAANVSVGTASAAPGQRATGYIEVPAGVDAATGIPVIVIQGRTPGKTIAMVSGAHGTEYASIIALEKFANRIDPAHLSGTVIVVPLVNLLSFRQKVPHVNPIDGKSMNRMYPGRADGTQSDRAALAITKEVVDKSDYLIDLHGGDLDESLRPYAYLPLTGNADQDNVSRGMVLAFGLDHIIIANDRPTDPNASRYLDSTATTRGKPAITVEAGHAGTTETDDIELLANGCINVLKYLKMLAGSAPAIEHPVWFSKVVDLTSDVDGIFYPLVKRGTYVEQGMEVGYVTDFFGKTIYEARSPISGVIMHICAVPSMKKSDNIANIGQLGSAP
jgi:predicted deacylase